MNRRERRAAWKTCCWRLRGDYDTIHPANPITRQRVAESIHFVFGSNPYGRDWNDWYLNGDIE